MMDRRTFVRSLGAGAIAAPLGAFAQPASKIQKLGILNALPREAPLPQVFLRGLRDLEYVEGKNITVEYRSGAYDDFPALADDLVKLKVDVIYAVLEQAALAASKATTTIPIVFAVIGDPVRSGLVASLARMPDGPRMDRPAQVGLEQIEEAGRVLGVQVRSFPVRRPSDISDALEAATRERIGALIVEEDSLTYSERNRIIEFAAAHQLPAIYGYRDYVVSCGLISYGAKLPELMHRALYYIDKILKGAKPGDLPIEQPTKLELVINAKPAKTLGLTIPQSLLLRADEVLQ